VWRECSGGAAADGHLLGKVLAFGITICMAIMMLIIRQDHETPMSSWPPSWDISGID